jgi:ABC-type uncharacterized transport system substrate-binding protein
MNTVYLRLCLMQILILLIFSLSSCTSHPTVLNSKQQKSLLIINSDQSVKEYNEIYQAFKSKLGVNPGIKIEEVDLARVFSTETVKRKISIMHPDVVHVIGSKAYELAAAIIKDEYLVFSGMFNWRRFKENIGYRTYGIALELPVVDQLFMCSELFPNIQTLGVLYSERYNQEWFNDAQQQAEAIGLTLYEKKLGRSSDITGVLKETLPHVDALWLIPDPIILDDVYNVQKIFKETALLQKPIIAYDTQFSKQEYGAILTMAADISVLGEQAATLVKDILKGHAPLVEENVLTPTTYDVIVNLIKAREYKIEFNETARSSMDDDIDIIE